MAKATVGPWQIMNDYDGATVVIANVDGESFADGTSTFSCDFICDTFPDDADGSRSRDIAKANARLIAAAPKLLEALTEAKAAIDYAARGADVVTSNKLADTLARIDAALAKAGAS